MPVPAVYVEAFSYLFIYTGSKTLDYNFTKRDINKKENNYI